MRTASTPGPPRVLVTGGAAGIGQAIAERFSTGGSRVHVFDLRPPDIALPGCSSTAGDVSSEKDVVTAIAAAVAEMGGLDTLINNAGISGDTQPIQDVAPDDVMHTLGVNVLGPILTTKHARAHLEASDNPSIVNVISTAGIFGYPLRSPYVASKWALTGLTKTWAMELGPHGIRVNGIAPGSVDGPRMDLVIAAESAATGRSVDDIRRGYADQVSLRRFVTMAESAAAAWFLASTDAAAISGQILAVDGHTETLRA